MSENTKSKPIELISIPQPEETDSSINRFKSKRSATLAGVETLPTALPHHRIADAKDFVRLHPNEDAYWSDVLCFVSVPIQGQNKDTLHLILEDLAMQYLSSAKIQRFRLALGAKPYDKFFLCHVPSENLENTFNQTALVGCEKAKQYWVEVTSAGKKVSTATISAVRKTRMHFQTQSGLHSRFSG